MQFALEYPEQASDWDKHSETLVLLSVPDENSLLDWADRFAGWCSPHLQIQAPYSLFYEPDVSANTALATLLDCTTAKKVSHLPLVLRGGEKND